MPDPAAATVPSGPRPLIRAAALSILCAVLFLTFLDTTVVSVTLGALQSDLHAGVTSLQWIINGYSLAFAALMLTAGTLADRYGRRLVMTIGITVFCAGSIVAALATSSAVLVTGRIVMGVGAAASEPGTLSILRQLYPDAGQRARAVGVWSAVAGLALALGPVLGGVLIDTWSWRAVFWFNAIATVALLLAVMRFVPESADPQPGRIDLAGFILGAGAVGCGTYAVIAGETVGYGRGWVVALFALSVVALVVFVVVEGRVAAPMLDLRYLNRAVNGALFTGFGVFFGVFSIFFFTALYLDEVSAYSGAETAKMFAPMAVAIALGSVAGGWWVPRRGPRDPTVVGCLLAAGGILLTAHLIQPLPRYGPLALALALAGLGFGLAIVPVATSVLSSVPSQRSGMAASATNTSRQLGAVAGVAVLGALVNTHLTTDLRQQMRSLGVPSSFQSVVMDAVTQGRTPTGGSAAAIAQYGDVVEQVFALAYDAFRSGLVTCLILSAGLILATAVVSWFTAPAVGESAQQPESVPRGQR
ncbi:MAG: MFS transporter [Actinobacteria bacterium]|nr:MFS transporter [Actinomycetota bacterium]